jgi:hypothetical protein
MNTNLLDTDGTDETDFTGFIENPRAIRVIRKIRVLPPFVQIRVIRGKESQRF